MREIAVRLTAWARAGTRFALATVVSVNGSAPRAPGATMAVSETGEVLGSVSGGCVEGTVHELCQEVLSTGAAVRESFGYSDDTAFAVGLSCGGTIEVCVQPQPPSAVLGAVADWTPVAVAQLLDGSGAILAVGPEQVRGSTGAAEVDVLIAAEARAMLDVAASGIRAVRCRPGTEVFIASYAPRPRLLVFGATDHAGAVASLGAFLGYEVAVCDARSVFATPARFPDADQVVVDWPHRFLAGAGVDARTVICVLTHDPKFDVPLLEVALRTPAGYIGAMGSRRTHDDRLARLREAGLTADELARLRSPIGLDLGARTPEETAVSIAAELIQLRWGGTGQPLTHTQGRIHHQLALS